LILFFENNWFYFWLIDFTYAGTNIKKNSVRWKGLAIIKKNLFEKRIELFTLWGINLEKGVAGNLEFFA
jgi:hypothetical protein